MPDQSVENASRPSLLDVSEWPLRRKLALALAIPMLVAAVFGGLRFADESASAANYSQSASQVTILEPAIDFLNAAEDTAVTTRDTTLSPEKRDAAIQQVDDAGAALEDARADADLTEEQSDQLDSVLELAQQLRSGDAYVSIASTITAVRQLHRGTVQLITTLINAQAEPEPKLQLISQALDGRLSLTIQQIQVASVNTSEGFNNDVPFELISEIGVEAAAIDRLASSLGQTQPEVLTLRQQNAQRLGAIQGTDRSFDAEPSKDAYAALTGDLLDDVAANLDAAASKANRLALLNGALTLLALIAAIALALLVSRMLLGPIQRVREDALKVANETLPAEVARIRAGEEPSEFEPIGVSTHEEMGQLARAVDGLHQEAVRLAAGEAELRSQIGAMFVTLSRRNNSLINQQLHLIERLESDEEDPKRLESLFKLDHLASRMRRTAESLMILSDAPLRGSEQDTLTVADTLQAATAGVTDYQRVRLGTAPEENVSGRSVGEIVHLLTELIDNALAYSPPTSIVQVDAKGGPRGVTISIHDAGLGMPDDTLAALNADLKSGGEITPDTARRMGLLVSSRIARRHDVDVALARNEDQGITATVKLPSLVLGYEGLEPEPETVLTLAPAVEEEPVAEELDVLGLPVHATDVEQEELLADETVVVDSPAEEPALEESALEERVTVPDLAESEALAGTDALGLPTLPARRDRTDGEHPGTMTMPTLPSLFHRRGDSAKSDDAPAGGRRSRLDAEAGSAEEYAGGRRRRDDEEPAAEDAAEAAETAADVDAPVSLEKPQAEIEGTEEPGTDVVEEPEAEAPEEPEADAVQEPEAAAETDVVEEPEAEAVAEPEAVEAEAEADEPAVEVDPWAPPTKEWAVPAAGAAAAAKASTNGSAKKRRSLFQRVSTEAATEAPPEIDLTRIEAVINAASGGYAERAKPEVQHEGGASRSSWLSAEGTENAWGKADVLEGWEGNAPDPASETTDSGLPVRRPGARVVAGGGAERAPAVRDPEAIRARLTAHRAGVRAARSAATDDTPTP